MQRRPCLRNAADRFRNKFLRRRSRTLPGG